VIQDLLACSRDSLPPLGILPAGTGDALARDLGIAGSSEGARCVVAGTLRPVDLARVHVDGVVRHAFSVVGWGAFARINWRAERWRILGGRRYDIAALVELMRPRLQDTRAVRDGLPDPSLILGVACLTRYTARGMLLAPAARLDDGMVEVVEIRRAPRRVLLSLLGKISKGHPPASPLVSTARVPGLELTLEPGSRVVLDGESLPARKVKVEVLPGALRVFAASA
jgi:diacylglycerol kinase (ATP)